MRPAGPAPIARSPIRHIALLLLGAGALALVSLLGVPRLEDGDVALVLDGDAWVTIPAPGDVFDMVPGGELTFSIWVRYDRPQFHAKIFDKMRDVRGYAAFVHQYSTSLAFWHRSDAPIDGSGYNVAGVSGPGQIGDGGWHHVAIVQRDTRIEGWVDGRLDWVGDLSQTIDILANDFPLTLGWDTEDFIRFAGSMDEFSIWDRALSGREIRRLRYDRPEPDAEGLVAYWPMDGPDADRVPDAGPGGYDGVAIGISRTPSTRPTAPPPLERLPIRIAIALTAIALLYATLRLYGHRLERQKMRLEQQVADRVQDLARAGEEKDRAMRTIAAQAQRLADIGETRSRFFTNISHEFRTPLSLILGPLSHLLAQSDPSSGEDRDEAIRVALRNGRRLQHLTEQLLDLARLESGALVLERTPLDLVPLLRELAESFRLGSVQHGVSVEADIPDGPIPVLGDPQRLETVFANLLSNALRFTPRGSTIRVSVAREADRAVVLVEDEGPGVPVQQAERIFERFFQTRVGVEAGNGTGVGLALVRELTELHGGTVRLMRAGTPGAVFRVELPVADDVDVTTFAPPVADRIRPPLAVPNVVDAVAGLGPEPGAEDPPRLDDPDRQLDPVVLIVEDHSELRAFTRSYLAPDFRVVEAADGHEGLALARELTPDVIVSDVMMPWMDGLELLTVVREDEVLADVPFILLTAKDDVVDRIEGLERGADAYMSKPFEPAELTTRIRGLLALRMRLRERLLAEVGVQAPVPTGAEPDTSPPGLPSDAEVFRARLEVVAMPRIADPDFGVSELAAGMAMERTGLYRHMSELLDTTPSEFLRELRMTRAAELLDGDNTVSDVAYAVGYGSVSSFSRRFRDHFGVPPGQWWKHSKDTAPAT